MSKLGCSLDAGKSFLGIMGLLWQAVSVTLVTCWSESTCFFFSPLLAGRFFSTLLLCKQWHFCSWRTLLRQPQFFSPLFFSQQFDGRNSSPSFRWTVHFVNDYGLHAVAICSRELMQKSQHADCSFVQVLCAVCTSSVCSCLLAGCR